MTDLSLSMSPKLAQRMNLQQIIALNQFVSLPPTAVGHVLDDIARDPQKFEDMFVESNASGKPDVQAVFGSLVTSSLGYLKKGNSGLIMDPPSKEIAEAVSSKTIEITPEVTYVGREKDKPLIMFSNFISEQPRLSVQQIKIPDHFKNAKKLYAHISSQREYVNSKLRESYVAIGEQQREFLARSEPTTLNVFCQKDLADKVGVSTSLVSRLMKNKSALVQPASSNSPYVLEISQLMPSKEDLGRFLVVRGINQILSEEDPSNPFSDMEIKQRLGINSARRTVSKYRSEAGIPEARLRVNYSGERQIPYFLK
ncbi:MAG: hypothetical protein AABW63_03310 [Nanoarchaeota archaeon]